MTYGVPLSYLGERSNVSDAFAEMYFSLNSATVVMYGYITTVAELTHKTTANSIENCF